MLSAVCSSYLYPLTIPKSASEVCDANNAQHVVMLLSSMNVSVVNPVIPSGGTRKQPEIDIPRSIYFGGAGWGGGFYVGVYRGLVDIWGPDFATKSSVNISGDSAGVLWAIAVALQFRPDEVDAIFRKQSYRAVAEGQWLGRNTIYLRDVVTELLSRDINAYQKLEGRFSTATTGFPFEHTRHRKWTSNSDLINCVLGSLHIPFYCSRIKPIRGVNVIDGAYSFCGHHLVHGDETLFIGSWILFNQLKNDLSSYTTLRNLQFF